MTLNQSIVEADPSKKLYCHSCGVAVTRLIGLCHHCGSQLEELDNDENVVKGTPKKGKSILVNSSARKEQTIVIGVGFLLLVAFSYLGYQGLASGKKGFSLSGAAGDGAQPESQNPSINSRAPIADNTQPVPKVITDKLVLERIEILKSQYEKEKESPKKRIAALALSETYIEAGRLDLGGEWSIRAYEATDKKEPQLLLRAANLYDDSKFHQIASQCYATYLEINPQHTDARVDYAISLLNQGLQREGVTQMRRAVDNDPKHQKAHLNLGILYAQIERWEDAKKLWQTAKDLNPTNDAGQRANELLERYRAAN